jgi:hypothetical protein
VAAVVGAGRAPGFVRVDEPSATTPGIAFAAGAGRFAVAAGFVVVAVDTPGDAFVAGRVVPVVVAFVVFAVVAAVDPVVAEVVVEVAGAPVAVVAFAGVVRVGAAVFGGVVGATAIAPDSSVEAVVLVELEPPVFAARNDHPGFDPAAAANACFAGVAVVVVAGGFAGVVAGAFFAPSVAGGTSEAFDPEPAIGFAAVVRSIRSAPVSGVVRPAVVGVREGVGTVVAGVVVAAFAAVVFAAVDPVVVLGAVRVAGVAGFVVRFASTVMP